MLLKKHKESLCIVFDKSRQTMDELDDILHNVPSPWRMTVCAGAGKLLGDLYMSIENIMRLFLEGVYEEKVAKDESWHRRLIDAGTVRGLLPDGIDSSLCEMRRFRHRLMHGYGVEMDEVKLRECIPEAIAAYKKVEAHIRAKYPELNDKRRQEPGRGTDTNQGAK